MHFAGRVRIVALFVASLVLRVAMAGASDDGLMQDWLKQTAHQGTIAPGTKINSRDWQQYKQFMPVGMIALFKGKYSWRMQGDIEMDIGPTYIVPMPNSYLAATENYSTGVRMVVLPDGSLTLAGYVAGMPFPNPQEPQKGWKILANEWFAPVAHLYAQSPEIGLARFCTQDRFQNHWCVKNGLVYRQLAYNSDLDIPNVEPQAAGAYYTEWLMIEEPEESKHTADLTIFWQDPSKAEDSYIFLPAVRRALRVSVSGRCSPLFGTGITHDDQRAGFNGGISIFQATFLGDRQILGMTDLTSAEGRFPQEYDSALGWPKPSWGPWTLRDVSIIDVRRIPSEAAGYCYGKRMMYIDKVTDAALWLDLYNAQMNLWKVAHLANGPIRDPASGQTYAIGRYTQQYWDLLNDHATYFFGASKRGRDIVINGAVPAEYHDIDKYSTPAGLYQIMQ